MSANAAAQRALETRFPQARTRSYLTLGADFAALVPKIPEKMGQKDLWALITPPQGI